MEIEKRIKHYNSSHKILLVGEGDFSFAKCLANAFGSAANMTATSLDSLCNIHALVELGCTILHEVDATCMKQNASLNTKLFDRIVYNFPHAGFFAREDNVYMIELHKNVVRGFFQNARDMLTANGEVHVTHKTTSPYSRWDIQKLGEEAGLRLIERVPFYIWEYPGYQNRRGAGNKCSESFLVGESATFKFTKA